MNWTKQIHPLGAHSVCAGAAATLALALCFAQPAGAQEPISPPEGTPYRDDPAGPFQIIDNIYVVGETLHLTNYLITTDEGHILIDGAFEESVPKIQENIEELGFRIEDIRYLVGTHAHGDHVAGLARLKELSGGEIMAGVRDVGVLQDGGVTDFRSDGRQQWRPSTVDRALDDGDEIRLGGTVLTAHATPGHTKGCTTLTMTAEENGVEYDVIFFCGTNIADSALPLFGHPKYPEMADDFAGTFARLKTIPVDVYLGGHGYWFWVEDKLAQRAAGATENPFIDPEGWQRALAVFEQRYLDRLADER
jgi:metallo-beta-lactamase class B